MVSRCSLLKPHFNCAEVTYVFTYGTPLAKTMVYFDIERLPCLAAPFYNLIAMLGTEKP